MEIHPLVVLVVAITTVSLLIVRFKINAFVSLVTAAIIVGLLSPKVALAEVMPELTQAFGRVCGSIGIVIALAALIGQCLLESGAADKIARVAVRAVGGKHVSLSLLSSGFVLSIPVFFDTVFYLLIPLARAMRIRTGGNYVLYVLAICAGALATHCLVPPTPGPLAMASTLGIDLGVMILAGAIIAGPSAFAAWIFAVYLNRVLEVPMRETAGLSMAELEELAHRDERQLPPFFWAILPILLPVALITSNTVTSAIDSSSLIASLASFVGNPSLALLSSAAISLYLLASQRGYTLSDLAHTTGKALASGALIVLITAAGGSFGAMLVQARVGETLGEMSGQLGVPLLWLSFLLACLFKTAQGSGTVSMITVSAIIAPLVVASPPPFHIVYIALAIGSGAGIFSWMNDSGFWICKQMSGLTEVETLKTWSLLGVIWGFISFILTQILAVALPLI